MEGSISAMTYKGSISDAIAEAQKQKKLFLVYISGEDEHSTHLEQSTWMSQIVAESISKYCIFLHLKQGSMEALQFSTIYSQKSVPSITAVGYNGVMLWQHEGYISAENFMESIDQAWASLHCQETAMALLTVALASKKPETLNSGSQAVAKGSSSASTSADTGTQSPEDRSLSDSKLPVQCDAAEPIDDIGTKPNAETSLQSNYVDDVNTKREEPASSIHNASNEVLHSVSTDVNCSATCVDGDCAATPQENLTLDESQTTVSQQPTGRMTTRGPGSSQLDASEVEKTKNLEESRVVDSTNTIVSDDVHLNIRLPNGSSLQRKFIKTDTLRSVKCYVDENQISGLGSYDLAIPYPRKVFSAQDMNSALSELGFTGRQALVVVPHRQTTGPQMGRSSSNGSQRSSTSSVDSSDNSVGYFGFLRRALSYVNPFSYLGGSSNSSNSEPAANDNSLSMQYRPNPALQSSYVSGAEPFTRPYSTNHQNPSGSNNASNARTSRPFGSNIHTLRHDEDDFRPDDRNTFWNGNSTQFGGDDRR